MKEFVRVGKVSDLGEGEMMVADVGDESILLSKLQGSIYAIGEVCPHANGPLGSGILDGEEIECPYHGSRFDLKTGACTQPPALEAVPHYAVRVEGDDILVGPPEK